MSQPSSSKQALRLRFRSGRMKLRPEQLHTRSDQICTRLYEQLRRHTYTTVAIFLPIRTFNEPDIAPLLQQLKTDHIRMQLPIEDGKILTTVHYEEGMGLKKSYGGTLIPETLIPVDPNLT